MNEQTYLNHMAAAEKTLYHIACGMLSTEADRQDALIETATRCWAHRHELKQECYFTTWSARILINVCRSMYRHQKFTAPMPENMPEPAAEDDRTAFEVRQAIDALAPRHRVVIVMHYLEGFSLQEMADILRLPLGTVKYRLHQARKSLRIELNDGKEA